MGSASLSETSSISTGQQAGGDSVARTSNYDVGIGGTLNLNSLVPEIIKAATTLSGQSVE